MDLTGWDCNVWVYVVLSYNKSNVECLLEKFYLYNWLFITLSCNLTSSFGYKKKM